MSAYSILDDDDVPDDVKSQILLVSLKMQKANDLKTIRQALVAMLELTDKVMALKENDGITRQ